MAGLCPPLLAVTSTLTVHLALKSAGSQTKPPTDISHLLLVSGLNETKHHFCQSHVSCCPPPHAAICSNIRSLTAHGADEIGADFPLVLTHLR